MRQVVCREARPLIEYTEPVNSRIFRATDALPPQARSEFQALRNRWSGLATTCLELRASGVPVLPLRPTYEANASGEIGGLPDHVLDAVALRDMIEALVNAYHYAIAEFDGVIGGRA